MRANQATFPVQVMCRVLGLSTSGYYAWLTRIHAELLEDGERVGGKRVGRLMSELGIRGASRRRGKARTTKRDRDARPAPDLVERDVAPEAEAKMAFFDFIEGFYNPRRRHSALGYRSPVKFESPHGVAA